MKTTWLFLTFALAAGIYAAPASLVGLDASTIQSPRSSFSISNSRDHSSVLITRQDSADPNPPANNEPSKVELKILKTVTLISGVGALCAILFILYLAWLGLPVFIQKCRDWRDKKRERKAARKRRREEESEERRNRNNGSR
jgi:hypothetical protein